ncbi:hypothetical protein Zmor_022337 [Zophobas morio]|uniref:Serpin domain-containing protein n=1 Tax=Zophobas morio TaxID=2755281 RepID=A0AA38M6M9_9CUCU|nr:hypothetical protein Zmor_022337 [Zophobas morio]
MLPRSRASSSAMNRELIESNRHFTSGLYQKLLKNEKNNFALSIFSTQLVLALTLAGAKEDTATELRTVLHFAEESDPSVFFSQYIKSWKSSNTCRLFAANKIYVTKKFVISEDFKKTAARDYKVDTESLSFEQNQKAASIINAFVEKQTKGKMSGTIAPDDLSKDTSVVLVNVSHFRARWLNEFQRASTRMLEFYANGKNEVLVYMMHQVNNFNYHESRNLKAQFIELPFKDRDVVLVVVLPKERMGLEFLDQKQEVFRRPAFVEQSVHVVLPKFKIENARDLVTVLQEMQIRKVFSDEANLTGIGGRRNGDLKVDKVVQKVCFEFDEEGVEASTMETTGKAEERSLHTSVPVEFIADHPFIFYIKIKDIICFAGRITDPSPSS